MAMVAKLTGNRKVGPTAPRLAPGFTVVNGVLHFNGQPLPNGGQFSASGMYTPPPAPDQPAPSPAPPPDPFLRADDIMAQQAFYAQWNGQLAQLDQQLGDLKSSTGYDKTRLAEKSRYDKRDIDDDAAARGIFQSSIRGGERAQEQTALTRNQGQLDDRLSAYETYVNGLKNNYDTVVRPQFEAAMNQKAVENARGVDRPLPAPAAPGVQSPGALALVNYQANKSPQAVGEQSTPGAGYRSQPGTDSQGRPGVWHIYPDGRKVFVRS